MSAPKEPTLCQELQSSASISYLSLECEEEVVQITKNLCDNLEKWGNDQAAITDLHHPRKKSRMTSSSTIPVHHRQGNYSSEEEVAAAAAGHYSKDSLDLKLGDGGGGVGQGPNQHWGGAKRKVGTYCESRHLKEKLNNNQSCFRRVLSNEMEVSQLVPFSFMRGGPWASPSPSPSPSPTAATAATTAIAAAVATPHSGQAPKLNDLYGLGLQACSAREFLHRSLPCKDPKASYNNVAAAHHIRSSSSSHMLKLPQDMQGRWSGERYKSAQLKLIDIMHERRAQPGRPILRPVLREEARKHIGDTGLLDHLLKHMTDTVVSTGQRFRRRHNAQGAMEYWLEDASLMDIRKAAGIEDPSWLPPPGWKPGDKVWEISRRMSSSEAAEMSQLKDTVEVLKRDMKFLFERLKDLKQMGILQVVTLHDADRVRPAETHKAHFRPCDDLAEKIEKQQAEQIPAAGNSNTVEWQLADIRKAISRMQSDVQCILELLG